MPQKSGTLAASISSRCGNRTLAGPSTKLLDLLGSGRRKRNSGLKGLQQMVGVDLLLAGESSVKSGLHRCVNFSSGKSLGGCGHSIQIKVCRAALASLQLDGKDLFPLSLIGQVDKEQLLKAAFANQLRR